MTTKKFDEISIPLVSFNLNDISDESVKSAWSEYEAKPEYKEFNKHDLIESLQSSISIGSSSIDFKDK